MLSVLPVYFSFYGCCDIPCNYSVLLSDYAILSFVFILHGEMFSFVLCSDLNHGAELIISVRIC